MSRESKTQAFARTALKKLYQGASNFNNWRSSFPDRHLDLYGCDLHGLDLIGVDLSAAKLKGANLQGTNLQGASLAGANLNEANLSNADLSNADLRQARMAKSNLQGSFLDGCNLFATIREEWLVSGVTCSFCWITRDRAKFPDEPDVFLKDEFEMTYGGTRVRISFPGGLHPIDLLSLPYHASRLMEEFPDYRLILTGLDTVGEPHLVFRLDEGSDKLASQELEAAFQRVAQEVRADAMVMYTKFLENSHDRLIKENSRLLDVVEALVKQPAKAVNIGEAMSPIFLGPGCSIGAISITNLWNQFYEAADQDLLRQELEILADVLKREGKDAVGDSISLAVAASKENQPVKMRGHLVKAGKWALDVATKIGVSVASKAITSALGLG